MSTATEVNLQSLLSSVKLASETTALAPVVSNNFSQINEGHSIEDRFVTGLAALVLNSDQTESKLDKSSIQSLVARIDELVAAQLDEILHNEQFKAVEGAWAGIADLVRNTNFKANIQLSLLDVSKDEAFEDLELNFADIAGSSFFKKVYVSEYDQFGGHPFGGMIGLFDFANTANDLLLLQAFGKVATASHAPFIASASPKFFGCETFSEVAQLRDVTGLVNSPRYARWNQLRESEEAAYIGLTLPRFLARTPYNHETNPAVGINFEETVRGDKEEDYLWSSSALLFARNMVNSFETSGWCQHIRGVKGGGRVAGLPVHTYNLRGEDEMRNPTEITIPDFRELEFANSGFIPLVQKKGSAEAVFFSAQSIKKSFAFKDAKDSENSQLVTNLSYTLSITRIAHYIKCIMRDNIGSTADAAYIKAQIEGWMNRYITTIVNPDDLTLRYYPFKAFSLNVDPVPGKSGWYHASLSVLPHIQFEGMDVDLRVDARLG